jgi:ferredoxin-like protein FixX
MMSVYALAKANGVTPQSLYTLAKLGYLKATKRTCKECGHTSWVVDDEEVERYSKKHAAKVASK